jgi:hypothetical protein
VSVHHRASVVVLTNCRSRRAHAALGALEPAPTRVHAMHLANHSEQVHNT